MKRVLLAMAVLFSLLLLITMQASGEVMYGCVNRAGIIHVVSGPDECGSNESLIYISQGFNGSMKAYDSGDPAQYLGIVTDGDYGWPTIYVSDPPGFIKFDGDGRVLHRFLYFESNDCRGLPYIYHYGAYLISRVGAQYYIGQNVAPISVAMGSLLDGDLLLCQPSPVIPPDFRFVPAEEVLEGDLPFNLPITLPFDFRTE
jgi:hypothetical protein